MSTDRAVSYGVSWRAMPRNILNMAEYALLRSGPLANNVFESAAFMKTVPGLDRPDVQLVFQSAKRPPPGFPFPLGHGFAISPVGLYPRSRGRVTLASSDPFAAPLIDPNLLSVPEDVLAAGAGDSPGAADLRLVGVRAVSGARERSGKLRSRATPS